MRSSKSRSRGNKNRNIRPTGGNIINRVFDSSGPDGKVRGTPQQIIEKYNQLHRDAQLSNDRVNAENFAQHAEHYTRLLAEAQREIDQRRDEQEQQNRERQAERDRQSERDRQAQAERQAQSERDRERAQRQKEEAAQEAEARAQGDAGRPEHRPQPRPERRERAPMPEGMAQPDLDAKDEADSGLVETPETQDKPKAKPRTRARKPRGAEGGTAPEGTEGAPRRRRAKPDAPESEGGREGPAEAAE